MPNWLNKAMRATAAEPQEFSIPCGCGRTASGTREAVAQQLQCKECGELIFVLPADVYPRISEPVRARRTSESSASSAADRSGTRSSPGPLRRRKVSSSEGADDVLQPAGRKPGWLIVTPFRGVVAAIGVVLLLTIAWNWHVKKIEQARLTLNKAREAGDQALRDGNFHHAALEFEKVVQALDVLGREDDRSALDRQMFREARAAKRLALESILEIAASTIEFHRSESTPERPSPQYGRYNGQWMIVESVVERRSVTDEDGGEAAEFDIELPLDVEGFRVILDAPAELFRSLDFGGQAARQVVFAGEIQGCRVDDERKTCMISFESSTAFLWGSVENYAQLGISADEESTQRIRPILEWQQRELGLLAAAREGGETADAGNASDAERAPAGQ